MRTPDGAAPRFLHSVESLTAALRDTGWDGTIDIRELMRGADIVQLQFLATARALAPAPHVTIDPYCLELAKGVHRATQGCTVTALFPMPDSLRPRYSTWARQVAAIPGVYVYPFERLHLTVATLRSFKDEGEGAATQCSELLSHYSARLPQLCINLGSVDHLNGVISLVGARLAPSAGFLLFAEPSGRLEALRKRLKDEQIESRLQHAGASIPNILHSTVVRFTADLSSEAWAALDAQFTVLNSALEKQPVSLPLTHVSLVHEAVPYQHIEARSMIGTYRLCD
jgi:hypothetical protein